MAVYTSVSQSDLSAFLRAYDIGAPVRLSAIAEGIENSNYKLETEQGSFILTLYEKRVREADLPFFLALMSHLRERGLPCPRPVPARDGVVLRRLKGRPAAIVTFLPGRWTASPNLAQTGAAGTLLAQLHLAAADFSGTRPNDFGPEGWSKLYAKCKARADEVDSGLSATIGKELSFLEKNWPPTLPRGVIHGDLFPDNILYTDDQISGVIDFYFAAVDMLALDLAICLNAWCFAPEGRFLSDRASAVIGGYESVRPLQSAERAALPILARGAAMRFLLTRLYDRLHPEPEALVTPKDPLRFLKRLQFHQESDWLGALA